MVIYSGKNYVIRCVCEFLRFTDQKSEGSLIIGGIESRSIYTCAYDKYRSF